MNRFAEGVCTAALGKYKDFDFHLYEEDDHIVTLEHRLCGFKDRFLAHSVRIEAIQNDCQDHLTKCPAYRSKPY